MELISSHKCFEGKQLRYKHHSHFNQCEMTFSIFLPPQAENERVPMLMWLSGLTCNDENFVVKAGAQKYATEYGMAIVTPDTSPRGEAVKNDDSYDLGQGAGFYVNATEPGWAEHFQMYDYITQELPQVLLEHFPLNGAASITGHSMGGHGALTLGLRNPKLYRSISAFAPICHPMNCPWGQKAFSHYLGENPQSWEMYDALKLLESTETPPHILIDQGEADSFLEEQLNVDIFTEEAFRHQNISINRREGYDHSYFFIASFIESHIIFHSKYLA